MDLRSRSRSKTPLLRSSVEKQFYEDEEHVETVVRSTRSSTVKTMESNKAKANSKSSKVKAVEKKYFTSDYSSEEGDYETTPLRSSAQNAKNEFIEDYKRNGAEISALKVYKEAGEYWNKYPKTDYTYSRNSKDRIELAPGVVAMPNMSRRSLHSYDGTEQYVSDKHTNTEYYEENRGYSSSRNSLNLVKRALFSNNNYEGNDEFRRVRRESQLTIYQKVVSIFIRVYTAIFSVLYLAYFTQRSWLVRVAKWIHAAASYVMMRDSRLLRRPASNKNNRKMSFLLLLLLIPLLLLGGWWLSAGVYEAYTTMTSAHLPPPLVTIEKRDDYSYNEKLVEDYVLKPPDSNSMHHSVEIDTNEIVQKILNSPRMQDIFASYASINNKMDSKIELENSRASEIASQQAIIERLKEEIEKMRLELFEYEKARKHDLSAVISKMDFKLSKCCRRSLVNVEGYVLRMLKDLFGMPNHVATQAEASDWLRSLFVAKEDLEARIDDLTKHLSGNFNALIAANTKSIMDEVTDKVTKELTRRFDAKFSSSSSSNTHNKHDVQIDAVSDERIRQIVQTSLALYDADKTGLVDYAMEPSGGQIISTRCTETYNAGTAVVSVFGVPLWYPVNTPRTVISPGIKPGECWAFQNFPGYLIVKLVRPVRIEMFSYEHISRLLVPGGNITSAPKDFAVYGLRHEEDKEAVEIGRYSYDFNGDPLQYFPVSNSSLVFNIVELVVNSNHGNPSYTCLYRFRVHGTPTEPT